MNIIKLNIVDIIYCIMFEILFLFSHLFQKSNVVKRLSSTEVF